MHSEDLKEFIARKENDYEVMKNKWEKERDEALARVREAEGHIKMVEDNLQALCKDKAKLNEGDASIKAESPTKQ